jgi:cholest-4-en-3-one 26-monooxygenase
LVNRGFTPRLIGQLAGRIREACESIVDRATAVGQGDFVTLCSAELPLVVIADLMGVPQADRHQLFEWSNRMLGVDDPDFRGSPDDGIAAAMEVFNYANTLGAQRRACPADDIVTRLVSQDDTGRQLSELEFDLLFILLTVAGNETAREAISGGMQALIDFPDQWARLKADRSLLPTAADEIVRWVSPVVGFRRTATREVELGGQLIQENDKVVIFYSSANFDEAVFPDPYTFDVGRDPNPHLGFGGGGPHFCLGRQLALLEIQIMFETLLDRVDRVEQIAPPRRLRSNFINGVKEMPIRLIPG